MNKRIKLRSLMIGFVFTILFASLVGRLYWVQVVEASGLLEKAEQVWSQNKHLPAKMGTIYDRNDKVMVQDGAAYTVIVQPRIIAERGDQEKVVAALAPLLDMTDAAGINKLHSLVSKKREDGTYFTQVEIRNEGWKIDNDTAKLIDQAIDEQKLMGVFLFEEKKRYYPAKELASHVLGYRAKEGNAVLGIELLYDEELKGKDGLVKYDKDGKSIELPDSKISYEPAEDGNSMRLTIDSNIQLYIEQALESAYEQFKPKSLSAIAVNPHTMEILGMANIPNFDPNQYWKNTDYGDFYNHAIASTYEPGSTFKIITLAAAVEENLFSPYDTYKSGRINVAGDVVRDHNNGMGWGEITYLEGLKRSSNVAFVKLGYEGLGATKLREYIDNFGFGQRTGIDLPGEVGGTINFRNQIPIEVATATFGQGRVAVTAIQQLAAISAIANGGNLMKPYLVKEIFDSETGETIHSFEPTVVRRVVSERTSDKVGQYLEQVVSDLEIGTGRKAYIDGYRIAGKTGTAQKVIDGSYAEDRWIVSFIGYAPVEDPKIALIVIADEPDIDGVYTTGSDVGGPIFREIVLKSLRYYKVASDAKKDIVTISSTSSRTVPDLIGMTTRAAENEILKNGFTPMIIGHGQEVVKQYPVASAELTKGQRMYVLTSAAENINPPDFSNMSLRDALQVCSLLEIKCEISGEGYVTSQEQADSSGQRVLRLILQPLSQSLKEAEMMDEESDDP